MNTYFSHQHLLCAAGADTRERQQSDCLSGGVHEHQFHLQRRLCHQRAGGAVLHVSAEHRCRWQLVRCCGQLPKCDVTESLDRS